MAAEHPTLRAFGGAVNRGDTEAFLDLFTPNGLVDDNGRTFEGRQEIKRWSDGEFIGANAQVEVKREEETSEGVATDIEVRSSGFSGLSHLTFELEENKIRAMRIGDG